MTINYANGKIYKIISDETTEIYIGSTARKTLAERMCNHKSSFKTGNNETRASKILKYEDAKIILVEMYPCTCKDELTAREEYWRKLFKDVAVNYQSAHGRDEEKVKKYREENKELIKEYKKNYMLSHKEDMDTKRQSYLEKNKDHIKERQKKYDDEHKDDKKKYREEHKDAKATYMKKYKVKYNEEHKDDNKEKQKVRDAKRIGIQITCECGKVYTAQNKTNHLKTKFHKSHV